jgi:hypothetical protein
MTLRLVIRSLLTAAAGLLIGFVGASFVMAAVTVVEDGNQAFRMAAGYLSWFVLALLTVVLIRRFQPPLAGEEPSTVTRRRAPLRFSRLPRNDTRERRRGRGP